MTFSIACDEIMKEYGGVVSYSIDIPSDWNLEEDLELTVGVKVPLSIKTDNLQILISLIDYFDDDIQMTVLSGTDAAKILKSNDDAYIDEIALVSYPKFLKQKT